ncbi:hypothetical protein SUGI_0882440 [Cryptomeria japonica]|nr:hypothetical protein SUGI_0882440 [Cryptomeria japonica]
MARLFRFHSLSSLTCRWSFARPDLVEFELHFEDLCQSCCLGDFSLCSGRNDAGHDSWCIFLFDLMALVFFAARFVKSLCQWGNLCFERSAMVSEQLFLLIIVLSQIEGLCIQALLLLILFIRKWKTVELA